MRKQQLCYPPFFRRKGQKMRKRVYCWASVSPHMQTVTVLDEIGTHYAYSFEQYDAFVKQAVAKSWTVFTPLTRQACPFPWTQAAIYDPTARVLATSRKLIWTGRISGISWKRGRSTAAVIDADSWGFRDYVRRDISPTPLGFLLWVRATARVCGAGDYDTPAALGTVLLHGEWQRTGLPRLWLLPKEIRAWLRGFPVCPRIYDVAVDRRYPLVRELDLRSAYATTLSERVPIGQPVYITTEPQARGVTYGRYRVYTDHAIAFSPSCRVWISGEKAGVYIPAGEYTQILWNEEAEALRHCGATVTLDHGYYWSCMGVPFADMVAQLRKLRTWAEESGRQSLAEMFKRIPNAVVGRFNATSHCEILPPEAAAGADLIVGLEPGDSGLPDHPFDNAVCLRITGTEDCVPEHWYSFIVMRVALKIWRVEQQELATGHEVISCNIDSIRVIQPTLDMPGIDGSRYKQFLIRNAYVEATRYIDGEQLLGNGQWVRITRNPGRKQE